MLDVCWEHDLTEDYTLDSPVTFDTLDTDFEEVTFTDRVSGTELTNMMTSATRPVPLPPPPAPYRSITKRVPPVRKPVSSQQRAVQPTADYRDSRRDSRRMAHSNTRSQWTRDAERARENLASRRSQREALARVIAMAKPREAASSTPRTRQRIRPRTYRGER